MQVHVASAGALILSACRMAVPEGGPDLPPGFQRAGYIPEWPEPQYPPGAGPSDVIVRDGCFYLFLNGRVAALPVTERIEATGATSTYDRYCIG